METPPDSVMSVDSSGHVRRTRWHVRLVIGAALVAMCLKFYCASTTIGSDDVAIALTFGRDIYHVGLDGMYRKAYWFNHTPATGSFFCFAYALARELSAMGDHPRAFFPFILRFPMIIADFLVVLILLRIRQKTGRPPVWALVLFALSPVSFMVTGYHGNVDPMVVFFLMAAAYFCATEKHPLVCGLLFGLSCNVKIIPILFAPVFFFFWLHRGVRQGVQFMLASGLTCLAGWSAALIGSPELFLKNVASYNGFWGIWGISYWLSKMPWQQFHTMGSYGLPPAQVHVVVFLKLLVIAGVLFLAWTRRKCRGNELFSTLALAWTVFFVFAPGIAAQYMIWLAPFILLYSEWWYLALTVTSTAFLFVFYNTISHGMPWNYGDSKFVMFPIWTPWTNLPWLVLIGLLVAKVFRSPQPAIESSTAEAQPVATEIGG